LPRAPQVEKNVLETPSALDKCAQHAKIVEKLLTCSAACAERFTTLAPLDISDEVEQTRYHTFVPSPYGISRLSDNHNIPEDNDKHEQEFTESSAVIRASCLAHGP
jgi:hypothetical protein